MIPVRPRCAVLRCRHRRCQISSSATAIAGGGGPPCEAGWWRGRRPRRAARVLMMSGHVRSLASSCNENFCNENEAPRPARRHKSPSPGGGRSPREARRDGVKARVSALRLPASPRTPPRVPSGRDPPPPGEGEISDLVLTTRSASELRVGPVAN